MFTALAVALILEADFVEHFCEGEIEYRLEDRTRVDCLDDNYAIEYDWGRNWYEAIGQSLHYAMHTGRRAGVTLVIKEPKEYVYADRALRLIRHYNLPITLWTVSTDDDFPYLVLY